MPPVKVLHLIPTLSSGGAERQLANLVSSTSKEIVEHVVCVIGDAGFYAPFIRQAGCKLVALQISVKHPFLQAAIGFRKVAIQEKPDIIQSWLYDANISARLAMFLNSKIPFVTSLQLADYEPEARLIGNWSPHKVWALRAIDKFTSLVAKPYFIPCSEFVKNSYIRHYGIDETRTSVIFNSVEPKLMGVSPNELQKTRDSLGLPSDAFVYLNVGRLDPQKNHKVLLEAFRQVSEEIPNAVLLLAGVGGLENELKKLVEDLGISEKVRFLGRRSDVAALLELADVFVFPSFFEGLPVALIEAMFKSLPCIASRIEVFEEVITDGETGLLIDPNSANELKNAMLDLYNSEDLRKRLGENSFRHANMKFHSAAIVKQWEKLYQRITAA